MKTVFNVKPVWLSLAAALALSACANFAPKYEQPVVEIPAQFRYDLPEQVEGIQAAALGWQNYFADPRLHGLIELALKNNTDLRLANLNVEQVRAQYAISRSAQLPVLGGSGGATRSGNGAGSADSYRVGLGVTAFELDVWGRVRNSSEAALQGFFASEANRDATHLSLVAGVAKAYFNELYAGESIKLATEVLKSREETYRLSLLKHKAGVISALDLRAQEALIEQARTAHISALRGQEQARNALALLIGGAIPDTLPAPLALDKQFAVRNLPAGLSSQVLLNRPDIRAAEHVLRQANANIGVARAAFYPNISLTGSLGLGSNQLGNLFAVGSKVWSAGASLAVPVFDWGRNQANLDAVKVAQQKSVVAYEAAVRSAFRDVSDALVARAALNSQYDSQLAQSRANRERLRLVSLRYQHGVSSLLDLLDAQRSSYASDSAALATELNMMENLADLYKVLGGGLKRLSEDDAQTREQVDAVKSEKL